MQQPLNDRYLQIWPKREETRREVIERALVLANRAHELVLVCHRDGMPPTTVKPGQSVEFCLRKMKVLEVVTHVGIIAAMAIGGISTLVMVGVTLIYLIKWIAGQFHA